MNPPRKAPATPATISPITPNPEPSTKTLAIQPANPPTTKNQNQLYKPIESCIKSPCREYPNFNCFDDFLFGSAIPIKASSIPRKSVKKFPEILGPIKMIGSHFHFDSFRAELLSQPGEILEKRIGPSAHFLLLSIESFFISDKDHWLAKVIYFEHTTSRKNNDHHPEVGRAATYRK